MREGCVCLSTTLSHMGGAKMCPARGPYARPCLGVVWRAQACEEYVGAPGRALVSVRANGGRVE